MKLQLVPKRVDMLIRIIDWAIQEFPAEFKAVREELEETKKILKVTLDNQ